MFTSSSFSPTTEIKFCGHARIDALRTKPPGLEHRETRGTRIPRFKVTTDNRLLTTASLQPKLFPPLRHSRLCRFIHADLIRPRPGKAFRRPLTRGVDAHLRAEVRQPRGVIERIDRAQRELDVALRIDVVQHLQRHV